MTIDIEGNLARITFVGGAWTLAAARDLTAAAQALVDNREVRVVIVNATGPDFCAGPASDLDPFDVHPDPASALAMLRPPVIAAIDGLCLGPGLEVALATDIRIAGPGAQFALDHIQSGTLPAWGGTQRLPRCVQPGVAVGLALLGTRFDAGTAAEMGLVYSVAEDPLTESERLANKLLSRGPLALELTKEAIHRGSELPLRDGLRLEGDLNHQLAVTEDRAEGLQAFFDKRPPTFSGQ